MTPPPLEPKDGLDEILFRFQHQRKLGTFRIDLAKQALQSYIEEQVRGELSDLYEEIDNGKPVFQAIQDRLDKLETEEANE